MVGKPKAFVFIEIVLLLFSLTFLFYSGHNFGKVLPVPVYILNHDPVVSEAKMALYILNAPINKINELTSSVANVSKITKLNPTLIVALMYTESEFKYNAVSNKGYKGLMQTPWATKEYADVDILYGCRILNEKLLIADGDMLFALALYKGGNNPEAKKYARQTMNLYMKIKDKQKKLDLEV
jgi:soluble lytic murein transglycosylase-like protein